MDFSIIMSKLGSPYLGKLQYHVWVRSEIAGSGVARGLEDRAASAGRISSRSILKRRRFPDPSSAFPASFLALMILDRARHHPSDLWGFLPVALN